LFSFSKGVQSKRRRNVDSSEQASAAAPKRLEPAPPIAKLQEGKRRSLILGQTPKSSVAKTATPETQPVSKPDKPPIEQSDAISPAEPYFVSPEEQANPSNEQPSDELDELSLDKSSFGETPPEEALFEETPSGKNAPLEEASVEKTPLEGMPSDEAMLDQTSIDTAIRNEEAARLEDEEAARLELENFKDADIYESIDDIDDFDAFEEAQHVKGHDLARGAAPWFPPPRPPLNRTERELLPSEKARQSIDESRGPSPPPHHQAVSTTMAAKTLPAAAPVQPPEIPEVRISSDQAKADTSPPQTEVLVDKAPVQSGLRKAENRRPKIGAVHGAKLSSLMTIPMGDEAASPDMETDAVGDVLPAAKPWAKTPAPTPAPAVSPVEHSDLEMEVQPASQKQRRRQPTVNTGFMPTMLVAEAPRLRRFAAAMIGDEGSADLLVQQTLQQAFNEPGELSGDRDQCVSLLMILYRLRAEIVKSQKSAQPAMSQSFGDLLYQRLQGADVDEIREFADAIGRLEEEDRAILLLISLENLDYRDIATIIKVPAGRVMAKVAHAREQLSLALDANLADAHRRLGAGGQR